MRIFLSLRQKAKEYCTWAILVDTVFIINNMYTKELSEEKCHEIMDDFLDRQDDPKTGIFWYEPIKQELFGVSSTGISDIKGATIQKLHK